MTISIKMALIAMASAPMEGNEIPQWLNRINSLRNVDQLAADLIVADLIVADLPLLPHLLENQLMEDLLVADLPLLPHLLENQLMEDLLVAELAVAGPLLLGPMEGLLTEDLLPVDLRWMMMMSYRIESLWGQTCRLVGLVIQGVEVLVVQWGFESLDITDGLCDVGGLMFFYHDRTYGVIWKGC